MSLSDINFEIAALLKPLENNPVTLLHLLGYACAITLIIALLKDAFLLQRQPAKSVKTSEKRPKPRADLLAHPPHDAKRTKL